MPRIHVSFPKPGITRIVIEHDQTVFLDFDVSAITFGRTGADLALANGQGEGVTLADFFITDIDGNLPVIEDLSGTTYSVQDFLFALNPELNLEPAAGAQVQSGGVGTYDDDSGELLAGLNALEGIEPLSFVSEFDGSAVVGIQLSGGDMSGSAVLAPPSSQQGEHLFSLRAALLGADGDGDPSVRVNLATAFPNLFPEPFPEEIVISDSENYMLEYDSATGEIVISLATPENGAASTETVILTIDGEDYVLEVGSTISNDLTQVQWRSGDELIFIDKTWAGSEGDSLGGSNFFISGNAEGDSIKTPVGYINSELYLQLSISF